MNITINHYVPGESEPYDVEHFDNILDFTYDSHEKSVRFTQEDGKIYTASYRHPIIIDIQTNKESNG